MTAIAIAIAIAVVAVEGELLALARDGADDDHPDVVKLIRARNHLRSLWGIHG